MPRKINMTNERFASLTVEQEVGVDKRGEVFWSCKCDCGTSIAVSGYKLRSGHTQSCGCLQRQRAREVNRVKARRHGDSAGGKRTSEYGIWQGMKQRCLNSNCHS